MEASALQAPSGVGRFRSSAGTPFLRLRSDDQLVELFRAGHEEAFRVIHDRYRARLFAYTRQMLPNSRHDAEDALQDVFIRAYSGLRANDRHLALRAWLYRVAHNRCVDQLRKNMPIVSDEIEVTSKDVSTDPMAAVEQREDLRKLVADVQRLPEQQRSALLLRELSGMSYQELADSMELSVPAIKSLLVRARTGLNAAAEARDTDCASIRSELVNSHEHGHRPSALTRRHLSDCAACREYRESVRGVSKSLAALVPAGPLVLGLKLLGVGSVYSAAAYSGTGGAAAGGAVAGGAAVSGAAVSGAAAAGAAAATGAAAGGAAVGSAAAGGAIVSGVSAAHIAAIIAAAAAAGGAVAVTQQSTPHKIVAPVHPAAALISKAVHSAVAHGYSPAAAVAPLAPLAGAAKTVAPAAPSSETAVSTLRHAGAATAGASTVTTTAGSGATTTAPGASATTSTTASNTSVSTTASGAAPVLAGSSTTPTPAAATSAAPTSTMLSGGAPVSNIATISTPTVASTPSTAAADASSSTARTDNTPPTTAPTPIATSPTSSGTTGPTSSATTSPTTSGTSSATPASTSSASTALGSTSGAATTAPSTEPTS